MNLSRNASIRAGQNWNSKRWPHWCITGISEQVRTVTDISSKRSHLAVTIKDFNDTCVFSGSWRSKLIMSEGIHMEENKTTLSYIQLCFGCQRQILHSLSNFHSALTKYELQILIIFYLFHMWYCYFFFLISPVQCWSAGSWNWTLLN